VSPVSILFTAELDTLAPTVTELCCVAVVVFDAVLVNVGVADWSDFGPVRLDPVKAAPTVGTLVLLPAAVDAAAELFVGVNTVNMLCVGLAASR